LLSVKRLNPNAILPTVAHPGEDLAYDLYALEDVVLGMNRTERVRTGIAAQAFAPAYGVFVLGTHLGLLVRDRSSMAGKGIVISGGVIDHGYTGEINVLMTLIDDRTHYKDAHDIERSGYQIKAGDKIAQMIPILVLAGNVIEVAELSASARGAQGFGSTGR
jgi:dUTP pyrophosphatase